MTWSKRQVTVRGPTPPFSGVMAVRSWRSRSSSEASPLMMPFSEAVPASIRTAPGLIMELEINPGTPVAEMIISYWLSFVKSSPLWKTVTFW